MAYSRHITPNSEDSVHQTSPGWMLTFITWYDRDPMRSSSPSDYITTKAPIVVVSDCVQVDIVSSKTSMTPAFSCVLKGGDINYSAAIAPGDFCFINVLNFDVNFRTVSKGVASIEDRAKKQQPINRYEDGFKGLYKIQSVRRSLVIDPTTGTKTLFYKIEGYAFTEFNNIIYFNPVLKLPNQDNNLALYSEFLGKTFNDNTSGKAYPSVGYLINRLVDALIGNELNPTAITAGGTRLNNNEKFQIPPSVAAMLNKKGAKFVAGITQRIIGVQVYNNTNKKAAPERGFNDYGPLSDGLLIHPLRGAAFVKPQFWTQVAVWSILRQYLNDVVNEMYTTFRVDSSGHIVPTLIVRQIPFTTNDPKMSNLGIPVSRFLNLPRWVIAPELIYQIDLGREEAARFNFVQVYGRTETASSDQNQSFLTAQSNQDNIVYDSGDIKRNGLRPIVVSSNFDYGVKLSNSGYFEAPIWTKLVADWTIGGHLKENGTIVCVGIQEPICVGDNLQLDKYIYHIEEVHHQCSIAPSGVKTFRTTLRLSNGVVDSKKASIVYPETSNTTALSTLIEDQKSILGGVYPGIGDVQYTSNRDSGGESKKNVNIPAKSPIKKNKTASGTTRAVSSDDEDLTSQNKALEAERKFKSRNKV